MYGGETVSVGESRIRRLSFALNPQAPSPSAQQNIKTVVELEEASRQARTLADKVSDAIANFVGSISFVLIHLVWFGTWVILNAGLLRFDPYPFALLCMLVSLEGVLLSTFVLIKQNRMSQRADQRSHLDLQVNLLAEKEITKVLQLQRLICRHLEIKEAETDDEVEELSNVTAIDTLAHHLEENMPVEQ